MAYEGRPKEKWREISEDEIIRDRALRLEIAELDYNTGMKHAREEGSEQAKKQIVEKMLKENIDIETIAKVTGLTIDEIEKIR